jgi:hypothetical protein
MINIKTSRLLFFFPVEVFSLYTRDSNFNNVPLLSPSVARLARVHQLSQQKSACLVFVVGASQKFSFCTYPFSIFLFHLVFFMILNVFFIMTGIILKWQVTNCPAISHRKVDQKCKSRKLITYHFSPPLLFAITFDCLICCKIAKRGGAKIKTRSLRY